MTSPVISPIGSPTASPRGRSSSSADSPSDTEPDFLDLSRTRSRSPSPTPTPKSVGPDSLEELSTTPPGNQYPYSGNHQFSESLPSLRPRSSTLTREQAIERAHQLKNKLKDININSKITDNGDVVMDMTGYKAGKAEIQQSEEVVRRILVEEFGETNISDLMKRDPEGHLRIFAPLDEPGGYTSDDAASDYNVPAPSTPTESPSKMLHASTFPGTPNEQAIEDDLEGEKVYAKTLRLTSDQLKSLKLNPGGNDATFTVLQSKAQIVARIFYWKYDVPLVISDIDGTITKSDALGHVLAMIGRDWTHPGVGKLFTDIESNGYHIMYLTARSVGQADSTRYYLKGISQDGYKLPDGPVILSPDRTMAALKREVIMKKPEVFKMACLRDIKSLYGDLDETPFYAGFGNRITDALSYRSVGVPSSRIFTINPNGDVHLELLELSGYKSSYVSISDLVDHFFPPAGYFRGQETYTDLTYWRETLPDLSELESDESNDEAKSDTARSSSRRKEIGRNPAANASVASIPGSPKQHQSGASSLAGTPTFGGLGSSGASGAIKYSSETTSAISGIGSHALLPNPEIEDAKEHYSSESEHSNGDNDGIGFSSADDYDDEDEDGEGDDEEEDEEEEDRESQIGYGEYESDEDDEDKESHIGHGEYDSDDGDGQEFGDDVDYDEYDSEEKSNEGESATHQPQENLSVSGEDEIVNKLSNTKLPN